MKSTIALIITTLAVVIFSFFDTFLIQWLFNLSDVGALASLGYWNLYPLVVAFSWMTSDTLYLKLLEDLDE